MIPSLAFGRTGHASTRLIFGAAALGAMQQDRADQVLDLVREAGINHIDTAAMYGAAELRLAPWLARHRDEVFLATKTLARDAAGVRDGIAQSLERMEVDCVDLIQFHNLTDEDGWQQLMAAGGGLEAAVEARERGLVRHIGVTGHGTQVAAMHLRSLERFDFDSVLLPFNYTMMNNADYVRDFEALLAECERKNVAVQTIKAIARRRWKEGDTSKRFSWYEPVRDPDAIRRAIHWALSRPGIFVNTTSDATLLPAIFEAGSDFDAADVSISDAVIAAEVQRLEMEPLFVRGALDSI